jgi:hypothetical protein
MRCHICNKEDDLITFDKKTGEFSPCGECEAVIQDCIDGYEIEDPELDDGG